jgi:hypothetical protein
MVEYILKRKYAGHFMQNVGFDVSFWDCPAKGRTGDHPTDKTAQYHNLNQQLGFHL